jgi:hypothetical protein
VRLARDDHSSNVFTFRYYPVLPTRPAIPELEGLFGIANWRGVISNLSDIT